MQNVELAKALPKIWIISFITKHDYIDYYLEALEQFADGVRSYEPVEDSGDWVISLHFNEQPDLADIRNKVALLSEAVNLPVPELETHEAENKNWVEELAKEFKAIKASKFYIYSQFSEPSNELIDIKINPGMAFGTGQHETTYLCLEAIAHLEAEGFKFNKILDLGSGSGILAIAADKIWDAEITATDNDPVAVRVAIENYNINRHPALVAGSGLASSASLNNQIPQQVRDDGNFKCYVSEGFDDIKDKDFDLILANILMNPLLEMAEDLAAHSNGMVVLSGFKTDQVERINEKYTSLGFTVSRIFVRNHWVAVLLSK